MTRKAFTKELAESVLIRCRRHCCVCGKFCGTKIELHHIERHDDNSESNVLPVCFDCHAEINHYNESHPRGRKYQVSELRRLRDKTFRKFTEDTEISALPQDSSAYGQGFHDGADLTEKKLDSQLVWNIISRHGDFAIEILTLFDKRDSCSMMEEELFDDSVVTGSYFSQQEGHRQAWDSGMDLGLWFLDPDKEALLLTKRGRFFREMVRAIPDLRSRYEDLRIFWSQTRRAEDRHKPGAHPANLDIAPGWLGLLQVEKYKPARIKGKRELFVLISAESEEIRLKSVQSPREVSFSPDELVSIDYDEDTGLLSLSVSEDSIHEA